MPHDRKHPGLQRHHRKSHQQNPSPSMFRHRSAMQISHVSFPHDQLPPCMVVHLLFQRWKYRAQLDTRTGPTGQSHVTIISCSMTIRLFEHESSWVIPVRAQQMTLKWTVLSCSTCSFSAGGSVCAVWVIQHIRHIQHVSTFQGWSCQTFWDLRFKDLKDHDQFSPFIWVFEYDFNLGFHENCPLKSQRSYLTVDTCRYHMLLVQIFYELPTYLSISWLHLLVSP